MKINLNMFQVVIFWFVTNVSHHLMPLSFLPNLAQPRRPWRLSSLP